MSKPDMVNHPPHYTHGGIECIDALQASTTPEGFRSYCKLATMKYLWRYEHKGGVEDLQKAQWYLARLIATFPQLEEPEPCLPAPDTSATTSRSTKPRKPGGKLAGRAPQTRSANGRGARR